jgi:rare lipoprotein A
MDVATRPRMSIRTSVLLIVLALLVAPVRDVLQARAAAAMAPRETVGRASWYGPRFHGRITTSGEVFDQNKLTAASPDLRMGTRLVVTNLRNGRQVRVRVNDRMPPTPGRALDLSHAAARRLGSVEPGVVPVLIQVESEPSDGKGDSRAAQPRDHDRTDEGYASPYTHGD